MRNDVVDCLEMDRLREAEEDMVRILLFIFLFNTELTKELNFCF